jgi:hypothetical protein
LNTQLTQKDARITELDGAVARLQANVTTADAQKNEAIVKARKEGKQEVINKIKETLPKTTMVSGVPVGAYRGLVTELKKKLYESENTP